MSTTKDPAINNGTRTCHHCGAKRGAPCEVNCIARIGREREWRSEACNDFHRLPPELRVRLALLTLQRARFSKGDVLTTPAPDGVQRARELSEKGELTLGDFERAGIERDTIMWALQVDVLHVRVVDADEEEGR